jgi:hypothetical protein
MLTGNWRDDPSGAIRELIEDFIAWIIFRDRKKASTRGPSVRKRVVGIAATKKGALPGGGAP